MSHKENEQQATPQGEAMLNMLDITNRIIKKLSALEEKMETVEKQVVRIQDYLWGGYK